MSSQNITTCNMLVACAVKSSVSGSYFQVGGGGAGRERVVACFFGTFSCAGESGLLHVSFISAPVPASHKANVFPCWAPMAPAS